MTIAASNARGSVVLSDEVLSEVWKDRDCLVLPSYITKAPRNFGSSKRGFKADEWRSIATIHLVVTLIRIWGSDGGRKRAMLHNFMHLVTAVQLASMRSTSEAHAGLYDQHFHEYLVKFATLYPEIPIAPNHHMSLHVGEFLRGLGPSHAVRTYAFERFNFLLQKTPMNMKAGTDSILCHVNSSSSFFLLQESLSRA